MLARPVLLTLLLTFTIPASLRAAEARLRRWAFEVERVAQLYNQEQANDKEVYDPQAEHDIAKYTVEERKAKAARIRQAQKDLAKSRG